MHNIQYFIYPAKGLDKNSVQAKLSDYVSHQTWQEGGHGIERIRWINTICDDEQAAQEKIERLDNHDYDQLAVMYRETTKPTTKTFASLLSRRDALDKKLHEIENCVHYKGAKSKFVSCKKCGSKIATGYLRSNYCPVCREDLRPKSLLDSINAMHERRKKIDRKIREAMIKASKKAPLYWLVKIEYHT